MTKKSGADRSLSLLDGRVTMHCGDVLTVLRTLPDDHFDCVVTSPPYWGLRDYGVEGQLGLERSLGEHLAVMVEVFAEVRRVLKPTGTLWLNYGNCYATTPNGRSADDTKAAGGDDRTFRDKPFSTIGAVYSPNHELNPRTGNSANKQNVGNDHRGRIIARGGPPSSKSTLRGNGHKGGGPKLKALEPVPIERRGGFLKPKDLCMVPNRLAIALQDDGWWVRSEIIWHKPNPMPESTRDRPTSSHEKIWLMTKAERYYYDAEAIAEPASPSTHARISQNLAAQVGSFRANGGDKTNGPMKAVMKGSTRKLAEEGSGIKNNRSFEAACSLVVETRNSRNVWTMGTQPFSEAHFATFPPELAERCIKAGSSEAGCCSACGAPWKRLTEKIATGKVRDRASAGLGAKHRRESHELEPVKGQFQEGVQYLTVGWGPSCQCEALKEPARVLDIFGGSGTTGMVAVSLGRRATLIELNPEYCTLARARIEAAFMGKDEGRRHMVKQLGKTGDAGPLFGGTD